MKHVINSFLFATYPFGCVEKDQGDSNSLQESSTTSECELLSAPMSEHFSSQSIMPITIFFSYACRYLSKHSFVALQVPLLSNLSDNVPFLRISSWSPTVFSFVTMWNSSPCKQKVRNDGYFGKKNLKMVTHFSSTSND